MVVEVTAQRRGHEVALEARCRKPVPTSSIDVYSIITWWIILRGCGFAKNANEWWRVLQCMNAPRRPMPGHEDPVGHPEAEHLFVELGGRDRVGHEGHEVAQALVARS